MKRKMSLKVRLALLQIGSFIVSIAPLIVVFAVNWEKYTETPADTVKLCFGGIVIAVLIFIKAIGKLRMPHRIVFFGIVFVMAYLLQALWQDILLLSGMALAGEALDCIFFQRAIRIKRENIIVNKTADVTTEKVEEVIKKYIGNGRV